MKKNQKKIWKSNIKIKLESLSNKIKHKSVIPNNKSNNFQI